MTVTEPRLTLERRLLREHPLLIACDEVGRGALAGPVAVVEHARAERQRLGGQMRQAGVLAAAGIVALEQMVERLAEDHAAADRATMRNAPCCARWRCRSP